MIEGGNCQVWSAVIIEVVDHRILRTAAADNLYFGFKRNISRRARIPENPGIRRTIGGGQDIFFAIAIQVAGGEFASTQSMNISSDSPGGLKGNIASATRVPVYYQGIDTTSKAQVANQVCFAIIIYIIS